MLRSFVSQPLQKWSSTLADRGSGIFEPLPHQTFFHIYTARLLYVTRHWRALLSWLTIARFKIINPPCCQLCQQCLFPFISPVWDPLFLSSSSICFLPPLLQPLHLHFEAQGAVNTWKNINIFVNAAEKPAWPAVPVSRKQFHIIVLIWRSEWKPAGARLLIRNVLTRN